LPEHFFEAALYHSKSIPAAVRDEIPPVVNRLDLWKPLIAVLKDVSAVHHEIETYAQQASRKWMRSIATTRICLDTMGLFCFVTLTFTYAQN